MAILLSRRGEHVTLYERRPDPRTDAPQAGRSINLALAARGIRALQQADLMPALETQLVTLRGRMLHEIGNEPQFNAYGQNDSEVIHSISRATLTSVLTTAAAAMPGVTLRFQQQCLRYLGDGQLDMHDLQLDRAYRIRADRIIGADGAGSALRQSLVALKGSTVDETRLDHDYKELLIPTRNGAAQLAMDSLHIWPRGGFMLIALPNADGSFTATLFLARSDTCSFESLGNPTAVADFFQREFPDIPGLIPDLIDQFANHPQGLLGTIRSECWRDAERLLLLGDAAHAIVPFHGQGMNCAFEDCRILDNLLADSSGSAFARFEQSRRGDCEAIAAMAIENYEEMRNAVRDPLFQRQKSLALALERTHPGRFIPRYSMVMFHDEIPYGVAQARGRLQQEILDDLTQQPDNIDWSRAAQLINERLAPIR
jgi:kynurenine 3-monooxygenase